MPLASQVASQAPGGPHAPTQLTGQGSGLVQGTALVAPLAASQGAPPFASGVVTVNTEVWVPAPWQGPLQGPVGGPQEPTQLTGTGFRGQATWLVQGTCLMAPLAASQGAPPLASGVVTVNVADLVPAPSQGASQLGDSTHWPTQATGVAVGTTWAGVTAGWTTGCGACRQQGKTRSCEEQIKQQRRGVSPAPRLHNPTLGLGDNTAAYGSRLPNALTQASALGRSTLIICCSQNPCPSAAHSSRTCTTGS